jgi:hypothetical protein
MRVRERSVMVAAICCRLDAMVASSGGSSRGREWEGAEVRRYQNLCVRGSIGGRGERGRGGQVTASERVAWNR